MGGPNPVRARGGDQERVTLSTGHTVELPLSTAASMVGAVVPARRDPVADLLPDGLAPLQLGPDWAAVTVIAVDYDRIGDDAMEPYDEFSVLVPAVEDTSRSALATLLSRGFGGYVWYMPVTTEPGRALGEEVWGYPKVVADVDHEDTASARRTTVSVDGETVISVELGRPPALGTETTGLSYSVKGGQLLREELELGGDVGLWPTASEIDVELGGHPRADALRSLDLGDRAVLKLVAEGEFVIHPGEPVR